MRSLWTLPVLAILVGCNATPKPDPAAQSQNTAQKPQSSAAAAAPAAAVKRFGQPITETTQVALGDIAKNPKAYENKVVATTGTVFAVCQNKGCWMEIKDDAGQAHVKLAGHSFFVPKDASGHKARVQAKVMQTDPDEECSQEAAEQTGKPVAKLQLEATGVELD